MFKVDHIDHVALAVRDVQRSVAWYREVLGMERRHQEAWGDYPAVVTAGETSLALFPCESPNPKPRPDHDTIAMRHVAFAVDRAGFETARERFKELGIESQFSDHGIAHSLYISDPDGHMLEITTYEV